VAVFTKYDQFKRDILMQLEDEEHPDPKGVLNAKIEETWSNHYHKNLPSGIAFVRLESRLSCYFENGDG